jgi:large subunit ribosomal protein L32e
MVIRMTKDETIEEIESVSEETLEEKEETKTSASEDTEDSVKIVDEQYRPKIKPVLDDETKKFIKIKHSKRRPSFKRQEWFRYKRLGDHWRRPRGLHSKMRVHKKYRPPVVRVGYRSPSLVRDLHPSGFREVLVHNVADVEGVNPEKEAIRIGRSVGLRKRIDIVEKADDLHIRVLNRRGL